MSRSRALALITAAALTAALAPAALASAAAPAKEDRAKAEHDRIVAYWTPERMKAAKPRDFVRQKDGSFTLAPTPKAGKPGGGTTPTPTGVPVTSGASWTAGGVVAKRTGKVYFRMGLDGYVCSGAAVDDGSTSNKFSLVLTAAHCAYDETGGGFAEYWLFIPDFGAAPYLQSTGCSSKTTLGCWTANRLVVARGFAEAGGFNDEATQHDFAVAVVGLGGKLDASGKLVEGELDGLVGSYRLRTGGATTDRFSAFGYPAAGKYKGTDLVYCSGTLTTDPYNEIPATGDDPWGMACKMTGGSSGGPWILTNPAAQPDNDDGTLEADGDGGQIASLNSYGYTGVSYMFGPVFNSDTLAVHTEAKKGVAGGNILVPAVP